MAFDFYKKMLNEKDIYKKDGLVDLSLGFEHHFLKDKEHIIYFNSKKDEFIIMFYFDGYYYECSNEQISYTSNKRLSFEDFCFYKSLNPKYINSIYHFESDDPVYKEMESITLSYINHFENHEKFKLKVLLKKDIKEIFKEISIGYEI